MACRALQQQGDERKGQLAWNNLTWYTHPLFLVSAPLTEPLSCFGRLVGSGQSVIFSDSLNSLRGWGEVEGASTS